MSSIYSFIRGTPEPRAPSQIASGRAEAVEMSSKHSKLYVLLPLLLYFCYCTIHTKAVVPCLPADAAALLQLRRSFFHSNLTSWQAGTDCCRWEAVACEAASGRVIALDLGGRDLQIRGIDPALFNLTALRNLSMAGTDFLGGSLPSFGFELLTKMVHLDFGLNTNLFGQLPIGIARLRKLVTFDISYGYDDYNEVSRLFLKEPSFKTFIANLSSLRELYLDGVDISTSGETWPIALANSTPRLQILSLPFCGLSGSIHHSFSQLHSLVNIDFSYNTIAGEVPEFFADFPLRKLDLSQNNFEGQFPTKVLQLKNLWTLDVSYNPRLSGYLPSLPVENELGSLDLQKTNFSDAMPASIVNLKSLIYLGLTTKGISQQLSLIGKLPSFRFLELYGSGIETPHFSWIGELRHLENLLIENYNFSEPIPTWISNLTYLRSLKLRNCSLYGPIPSWIGNLTHLNFISLENNYLTGKIPSYLFTLPEIQFLILSYNEFSGYLEDIDNPLSSSLTHIDLEDNQISGSIPLSYHQLKSLQFLFMALNKLTGVVELSSFWRLKNLNTLSLSNNMLSVIDGGNSLFSSLPNITILELASCNLTKLPDVLRYLDNIEQLDLSSNHIGGVIPSSVWENWKNRLLFLNLSHNTFTSLENLPTLIPMASLHALDLSNNRLEGNIPIPYIKIRKQTLLDYSNNHFNSILPNFGKYLRGTTYLDLSKNKLNGPIPTSVCIVPELQILDLSYNYFSGSIPPCLTQCNLRVLKLRGNRVKGVLPDNIVKGCMLQTVDLSSNYIEGKLPISLSNCRYLGLLDVSSNHIADSFPSWLSVLPHLRVLVLRANQFFGMITDLRECDQNMNNFSSLQILDLALNNFSGNLPHRWFNELKSMMLNNNDQGQVIGHETTPWEGFYRDTVTITFKGYNTIFTKILTTFRVIDLSNNSFSGPISESIGRLVSLHGLNMSYNNFTGQIPSQLGNLAQLESMDLSWNHLSGEIPPDFTSLTSLAWLNLSYNDLTGQIPQGNQFLSFPNSSFEGNTELCGSQVSKQCDNPASATPRALDYPESYNLWQDRLEAILLFTFIGLGFGIGFASTIMFQHFYRIGECTCKRR